MKNTLVINFFGGPGTRKSTMAKGVFSLLKMHGIDCEDITEYAKDLTWEQRFKSLSNQINIFAEQYKKLWRVKGLVDVVVVDSPLLFSLVYKNDIVLEYFETCIKEVFHTFNNTNYLITRSGNYDFNGRYQNEDEAKDIDKKMLQVLNSNNINYEELVGDYKSINYIVAKTLLNFGISQEYFITTLK